MFTLAMITLAVALAASVWTIAYAWTDTLPRLLWLERARREDAWMDTITEMHATLRALQGHDGWCEGCQGSCGGPVVGCTCVCHGRAG